MPYVRTRFDINEGGGTAIAQIDTITAESEANARLIAAAPDGLALARYAVDNPNFDSSTFDRMAREFIAKATGEQP